MHAVGLVELARRPRRRRERTDRAARRTFSPAPDRSHRSAPHSPLPKFGGASMPHSSTAMLRAFSRARCPTARRASLSGSMPRSTSLAPSSRITASVPSGTDQSSRRGRRKRCRRTRRHWRSRPQSLCLAALSGACAGNASEAGRPSPALSESPSTTILIGLVAARGRLRNGRRRRHQSEHQHEQVHERTVAPWTECGSSHMTGPWTASSNHLHWPALAPAHRALRRQSVARPRRGAGSYPQGYRPAI